MGEMNLKNIQNLSWIASCTERKNKSEIILDSTDLDTKYLKNFSKFMFIIVICLNVG